MGYILDLVRSFRKIIKEPDNKDDVTVRVTARRKMLIDDGCPEYKALQLAVEIESGIQPIDKDHPIWGDALRDIKKQMGVGV
jgi:hypothetical protein